MPSLSKKTYGYSLVSNQVIAIAQIVPYYQSCGDFRSQFITYPARVFMG
ncbi:hypothetical protein [Nostoc sp. FACHB-110]|nr:hypothetical protein [Nostoc sp. FACHB-110]MBD2436838.1 hypothetical protein [Nostoc sp. FACHB-110]